MIIKEINWDGYNEARIKYLNGDGSILCDIRHVIMEGELEVVSKSDTGISFPADNLPFDIHVGELALLSGELPTDEWLKDTIKLWLTDHGIDFTESETKDQLLAKVSS